MAFTLSPSSNFYPGDTLTASFGAPPGTLTNRQWFRSIKSNGPWEVIPALATLTYVLPLVEIGNYFYCEETYNVAGDFVIEDTNVAGPCLDPSPVISNSPHVPQMGSCPGYIHIVSPAGHGGNDFFAVKIGNRIVANGLSQDEGTALALRLALRFRRDTPT